MKLLSIFRENEKGQSLVEFALILPIFLLIVFGIIQFGFIFNGQITLTSAAREGARMAVVTDPINIADADDLIKDRVEAAAIALLLDVDRNDIVINRTLPDSMLSVSVDGEVEIIVPLFPVLTGNSFNLSGESKMRIEYQ